jgi:hypothetical protein
VRVTLARSAIPRFDRRLHHSSVPTNIRNAAARNGGPGRPRGRREAALPWTGASTAACLRRLGTAACTAVMAVSFAIALVNAARADSASTRHPASARPAGSFANLIEEASRRFGVPAHWIRAVMTVESAGDAQARSSKGANGVDADHARDLGRPAHPSTPRQQSLRSPRQHSGRCCVPPRTARPLWLAPAFSRRTMRARAATNNISGVVHCRLRPALMWQPLLLCSVAGNSPVRSPSQLFI